jgi:hypothetical protein
MLVIDEVFEILVLIAYLSVASFGLIFVSCQPRSDIRQ